MSSAGPDELGETVVGRTGASILRLGDLARIESAYGDISAVNRINGRPTISLTIYKEKGTNTLRTARAVKDKLAAIRAELPGELDVQDGRRREPGGPEKARGPLSPGRDHRRRRLSHGLHRPPEPQAVAPHPLVDRHFGGHHLQFHLYLQDLDEHADARRPGARVRHVRRQLDRRLREHPAPAGAGSAASPGRGPGPAGSHGGRAGLDADDGERIFLVSRISRAVSGSTTSRWPSSWSPRSRRPFLSPPH